MYNNSLQIKSTISQTVINNPVNKSSYWDKSHNRSSNIVISVGRLNENKNHSLLIHAFSIISKNYPSWKLMIYGEGEDRENLEQLIKRLNMTCTIFLPGIVDNLDKYLHQASIFVLTSNAEGLPNALIEALCMGLPCISTDFIGGGARELIQHELNGIIIPLNDKEQLTTSLKRLMNDRKLAYELGKNAIDLRQRFSVDRITIQWEDYLSSLIKSRLS